MVTSIVANKVKNADPQKVANILGKLNTFSKKNVKNAKFNNAFSKVNAAAQKRAAGAVKAESETLMPAAIRTPAARAMAPVTKPKPRPVPKNVVVTKTDTVIPAAVITTPTEYYEIFGQRLNKKTVNTVGTLAGMALAFGVAYKVVPKGK